MKIIGFFIVLLASALVVILALIGVIPGPFEGHWRPWETNDSVVSVTSTQPDFVAEAEAQPISAEMRAALPTNATVRGAQELSTAAAALPPDGVVLTFSLDRALPMSRSGDIAYWNEERSWWEPVPTTISADRRSLSATISHFSVWAWIEHSLTEAGSLAFNGLGLLTGSKVSPPSCDDTKPVWADPIFVDDRNGIVLWCYDDGDSSGELRVKLRLNRPYFGLVHLAIPARTARSDLPGPLGSGPLRVEQMMVDGGLSEAAIAANGYPMLGLGEYSFTFGREELAEFYTSSDAPLIEVTTSPLGILAGELVRIAIDRADEKGLAVPVALYTLAICGSGIIDGAADGEPIALAGAVGDCLADRAEDIARAAARYQLTRNPDMSWNDAVSKGRQIGKVAGRAWVYWEGLKLGMKVPDILGDMTLDPINRQFRFVPSAENMQEFLTGEAPSTGDDVSGATPAYITFSGNFADRAGYTFQLAMTSGSASQYSDVGDMPPGYTYAVLGVDSISWSIKNTSDRPLTFARTTPYQFPQASPVFQVNLLFDKSSVVCESLWRVTQVGSALPYCSVTVSAARFTQDETNLTLGAGIEKSMAEILDVPLGRVPGVAEERYADVAEAFAHPQGLKILYSGADADRFATTCGGDLGVAVLYEQGIDGSVCSISSDIAVSVQ